MKPYMLVNGNINNVDQFEDKISSALDEGYDICNSLVVKDYTNPSTGQTEVLLFQAMILEEYDEDEMEYEDVEELDGIQV